MDTNYGRVFVDIIIPTYNTEQHLLERCIKSILCQTYTSFNILIVDDGSSNEYINVLNKISKLASNIHIYHKENGGPASARNYGINCATSKYITFVDADDQVVPWFLSDAISTIENNKLDFIIGGNILEGHNITNICGNIEIIDVEKREDYISHAISSDLIRFDGNGYIGRGPWARIVKRDLVQDILFNEKLHIGEDICWNIDIMRKARGFGIKRNIWYVYSLQPFSITRAFNPRLFEYIQLGLVSIESRLNKSNEKQNEAYLKRIQEDIYLLANNYFPRLTSEEKKEFKAKIYSSYPWLLLEKPIQKKNNKSALFSLLFRTRTLIPFLRIKSKIIGLLK